MRMQPTEKPVACEKVQARDWGSSVPRRVAGSATRARLWPDGEATRLRWFRAPERPRVQGLPQRQRRPSRLWAHRAVGAGRGRGVQALRGVSLGWAGRLGGLVIARARRPQARASPALCRLGVAFQKKPSDGKMKVRWALLAPHGRGTHAHEFFKAACTRAQQPPSQPQPHPTAPSCCHRASPSSATQMVGGCTCGLESGACRT
jgi:hypothetical protein